MAQPNMLLLYTDQQRHDTIHALGNDCIRTPNLDRLVREGLAFPQATTPCPAWSTITTPRAAACHASCGAVVDGTCAVLPPHTSTRYVRRNASGVMR